MLMRISALFSGVLAGVTLAACGQAPEGGPSAASSTASSSAPTSTAAQAAVSPAVAPEGYVHVPGGLMFHPDCVHEIPEGGNLEADGSVTLHGKVVAHHERCSHETIRGEAVARSNGARRTPTPDGPYPYPPAGGWGGYVELSEAWAADINISGLNEFNQMSTGDWIVPTAPVADDQLVFLFPAIQSQPNGTIVQPVLQYGADSAGGVIGGPYWTFAAWAVSDGTSYHTTGIRVNEGDLLNAQMSLGATIGNTRAWWRITGTDVTTGQATSGGFWVDGSIPFNLAQPGVLEVYGIVQCSDFPASGSTIFGNPTVTQTGTSWANAVPVNPTWTACVGCVGPYYNGPSCNFGATAAGARGTTLSY